MHFFPNDPADAVARKALRVNLSDLAAKGAKPAGFLLSLALPKSVSDKWLSAFARGLGADAERYKCPLLGGDTDRTSGPVTISIAAFGMLPAGSMVRTVRREGRGSRCRQRHDRRRGARAQIAADIGKCRTLETQCRDAQTSARTLSHAGAAQCTGGSAACACVGRHGRVRWTCGRSGETLPRLRGRGGDRCCARAAFTRGTQGAFGRWKADRDHSDRRRRLRGRGHGRDRPSSHRCLRRRARPALR